jgi:hypothetical protein
MKSPSPSEHQNRPPDPISPYKFVKQDTCAHRYMLPVLSRFGGHAEASDEGRLVYVFPHLQISATAADPDEPSTRSEARLVTFM